MPGLRALRLGDHVGTGANHHDLAGVAGFEDLDAFQALIDGLVHRTDVTEHGKPAVARHAAIQHTL